MEHVPGYECKFSDTGDCRAEELVICELCHSPICTSHASPIDHTLCVTCASQIEVSESPLVDQEGIKHRGRVIVPIGITYKTMAKRLVEMTEDELITHIHHVKDEIKRLEASLDYRRIDLSSSTVELEERQIVKKKRLRLKGIEMMSSGQIRLTPPAPQEKEAGRPQRRASDKMASQLSTIAKALGVTVRGPEDLVRIAQAIKAAKDAAQKPKGGIQ